MDMVIYTASDVDIPKNDPHGFSGAVVKKLMEPYLNNNHRLFTDNYYTSPALAHFLLQNQTDLCGTVRGNRKLWPKFEKIPKGTRTLKHTDDMLAIRFNDNKNVNVLTTFHQGLMVRTEKVDRKTGEHIYKPDAVLDYNLHMRMVDKSDMQVAATECARRSTKWYKKLFFHLVDVSMLNAYNMWMTNSGNKTSLRLFSKAVIKQLLARFGNQGPLRHGPRSLPGPPRGAQVSDEVRDFLQNHHLRKTDVGASARGRKVQRRCAGCHARGIRKDVQTYCPGCNKGLCVDCFVPYHL